MDGGISFISIGGPMLAEAATRAGVEVATRAPFWLAKMAATDILVAGPSGSGKTCLAAFLAGELDDRMKAPPSSDRLEKNKARLAGSRVALRVLTGDQSPRRHKDLARALRSGRWADGVIYVVCNGFRQVPVSLLSMQPSDLHPYIAAGRRQELRDFREIAPTIQASFAASGRPKWMVVAITKADLFWHDDKLMNEAVNYYAGDGAFAQELRRLALSLGTSWFSIDVLPVASLRRDLYLPGGFEVESKMSRQEREGSLTLLSEQIAKRIRLAGR